MNVNNNSLRKFIVATLNDDKMSKDDIKKYDVSENLYEKADANDNDELSVDEILDNDTLYEKFTVLYLDEKEKIEDNGKKKEETDKVNAANSKSGV
jgi:hypothetical protein